MVLHHYQLDRLGTPQELVNDNGVVTWRAELSAWGAVARVAEAEIDNPLRFQGQYEDAETGLLYNRHRYYDPHVARYTAPDPIGFEGGINVHAYVPDPTSWVDPLGLQCALGTRFSEAQWQAPTRGTGQKYKVYQQDTDWGLKVKGETNLSLAQRGRAPYIEKNGRLERINLNHSRQDARGSLFEISQSTHRAPRNAGGAALHPYGSNKNPHYPVDRGKFDIDRQQYWIDRAAGVAP